jgi:Fe-S-cluster containining protein
MHLTGEGMAYRFEEAFSNYEKLTRAADQIFEKIKTDFPREMSCRVGCSDCCHALFDVSLVEALYLNHHFNLGFEGGERKALLEKANRADRAAYKIKRDARKRLENGGSEEELLVSLSAERVRCPLLDDRDQCVLYEYRPVTCRLYGVPTEIGGLSHSCGRTGFVKGKSYPTVHMEKMNQQLFSLAVNLVRALGSKYAQLSELVMPVSAAVMTDFNDEFLGLAGDPETEAAGKE